MRNISNIIMTVVFGAGPFACADTTRKAEENLERIRMKALAVDRSSRQSKSL